MYKDMKEKYNYPVIRLDLTGKRLKELRIEHDIKVPRLCNQLGISAQAVYKWERGDALPTIDNLLILSRIYDEDILNLIVYEEIESECIKEVIL